VTADRHPAITALWRRLDTPGHDACWLERSAWGWHLDGAAVFREDGVVARLHYEVTCDAAWVTQHGRVRGWLDTRPVDFTIVRTNEGAWTLNGMTVSGLDGCADVDLGFTPATNALQLRRVALASGQAADVPAAWLDVSAGTLERLDQRYERRTETTYAYEAPRFGYAASLEVTPAGFVRVYPGLWELEPER
jgi:hypothetical protein